MIAMHQSEFYRFVNDLREVADLSCSDRLFQRHAPL